MALGILEVRDVVLVLRYVDANLIPVLGQTLIEEENVWFPVLLVFCLALHEVSTKPSSAFRRSRKLYCLGAKSVPGAFGA